MRCLGYLVTRKMLCFELRHSHAHHRTHRRTIRYRTHTQTPDGLGSRAGLYTTIGSRPAVAKRREPAPHLSPRPGHRLTVVIANGTRLNIVSYAGTAQLVDACMQQTLCDHAAPDAGGRFSITSAPNVPDYG